MALLRKRALTSGEIALGQSVFGASIDYARVRVWRLPQFTQRQRTAVSLFGQIFFPYPDFCEDFAKASPGLQMWFMHELTHVWQHQMGFGVLRAGLRIVWRGGYRQRQAYALENLPDSPDLFCRCNMEQQAELVAHWFGHERGYMQQSPEHRRAVEHFTRQPHAHHWLPQKHWLPEKIPLNRAASPRPSDAK